MTTHRQLAGWTIPHTSHVHPLPPLHPIDLAAKYTSHSCDRTAVRTNCDSAPNALPYLRAHRESAMKDRLDWAGNASPQTLFPNTYGEVRSPMVIPAPVETRDKSPTIVHRAVSQCISRYDRQGPDSPADAFRPRRRSSHTTLLKVSDLRLIYKITNTWHIVYYLSL